MAYIVMALQSVCFTQFKSKNHGSHRFRFLSRFVRYAFGTVPGVWQQIQAYAHSHVANAVMAYGLHAYGKYNYGLYIYGLFSYGLCSYGMYSYTVMWPT